jgi:RNA polymerase sigma factor (sigma-70 family)
MSAALTAVIARCRVLCRPRSQATDVELLRRFAQQRDAAAFEELLERHAVLVWGVCRRTLRNEADCEDAFQATFLALVRRAETVEAKPSLGAWLHTVAVRVARKALVHGWRHQPQMIVPESATEGDVADEVGSRELLRLVDEEIERLPALLRLPLILCCLQGRTRDEAAQTLSCSVAAVKSRLERGRDLLRRRLERRGVQLPAAFLVLGLTARSIRVSLWAKTMQAVLYTPTPAISALAEVGVSAVTVGKSKLILAVLLLASTAFGAAGTLLMQKPAEAPALPQASSQAAAASKPETPRTRTDRHGDPLPDSALARLGTIRWQHGFFILGLAYSPDGKKIAAVGGGRAFTLWDAATGKELHQFPNRTASCGVAFSPDGKLLATAGDESGRLWDVASGKELRQLKAAGTLNAIAFAPDGKTLATAGRDGAVRLWDSGTGEERRRIACGQGILFTAAFAPDGKRLASGGTDGTIRLWDAATGEEQRRLTGHKKAIRSVVFSPAGKLLGSASDDSLRLWDTATGRQARAFEAKQGSFATLAMSPDGALLASSDADGTITLWDVATGTETRHWRGGVRAGRSLAFSPDGKTLASNTIYDGSIRLWDVATGREHHPCEGHPGFIGVLRFAADNGTLISLGLDQQVLEWDLTTRTPRHRFSWKTYSAGRVALSPDGNTLAAYDYGKTHEVRLWDLRTGKPDRVLGKARKHLWVIAFSPDGRLVAAGGDERVIHVWDVREGKEVRRIEGVDHRVMTLCFSPDGKALACGMDPLGDAGGEPTLRLWDVNSGKELRSFARRACVGSLAISPDGKVLASGDGDWGGRSDLGGRSEASVRLWDTTTGKELCRHNMPGSQEVRAVAFSPDGKLIASGGAWTKDSSVLLWEAATGRLIRRFQGHHSGVGAVTFAADGLSVASGAGDSTVLIWDITGRRPDGHWHNKPLSPRRLEACWTALANEDAAQAYDAMWQLVAAPEQAVPFLRKRLPPMTPPDATTLARWITELDSDDLSVRQRAAEELSKTAEVSAPALRRTLEGKPSLETRRRIQQLLDQTRAWNAERLRDHRAIQALEHIGTPQAKDVLEALAAGAPDTLRTEEAKAALQRPTFTSPSAK